MNGAGRGTKAAAWYTISVAPGAEQVIRCRLCAETSMPAAPFGAEFEAVFEQRRREAEQFNLSVRDAALTPEERLVVRQADAGLLWSRQFYGYVVEHWLEGDPAEPRPPDARLDGRDHAWKHLYARDVLSMPDKWEYPWFAAWDLAFHCVAMARVDPDFAKQQIILHGSRVVHAPERAVSGLRVRLRQRQPAPARLGGLARVPAVGARARAAGMSHSWRPPSRSVSSTSPGG